MKTKNIKRIFTSEFSRRGSCKNGLENLDEENVKNITICIHNQYCTTRRIKGENFCLINDIKSCQTYKFYERYKDNLYLKLKEV